MLIEKELNSNFTYLQQILDYDANVVPEAIVAPMLLNLCVRLRTLQACDWILLLFSCVRVLVLLIEHSQQNYAITSPVSCRMDLEAFNVSKCRFKLLVGCK